jgi:hypothetical protein
MAIDLNKAVYVEKTDTYITAKGIITFAAVAKKWVSEQDKKKGQDGQYALTLIVPAKSDLSVLYAAAEKCAKEGGGAKVKGLKTPFLKAEEKLDADRMPEGFDPTGWVMIRANTFQQRPGVMFANGATVPEDELLDEVYNGRWARMSVRPKYYDNESKGVKLYLHNIQLLDEADKWPGGGGGRTNAEDEFEAVEAASGSSGKAEKSSDSVFG